MYVVTAFGAVPFLTPSTMSWSAFEVLRRVDDRLLAVGAQDLAAGREGEPRKLQVRPS